MQSARDMVARLVQPGVWGSPVTRIALLVLGAVLCGLGLQQIIEALAERPEFTDMSLYMRAADALPLNPYDAAINVGFDRYGYPPLLAEVLAGLKLVMGHDLLVQAWPAVCLAGLAGAIVIMARGFGLKLHWSALLAVLGVVLLGRVVRSDIVQGQVNVFVLLTFVGGLSLRAKGRVIAASIAFAVMMSLKPFMGAVVIYFALKGDWRMTRWALGMGAAVFLASFLPMGARMLETWTGWRDATAYFTSPIFATKPDNQSAYGLALRMFTETPYSTPWIHNAALVPAMMALVMAAAAFVLTGLRLGAVGQRSQLAPAPAVMLLECCVVVAMMSACGPLTEGNHMLFSLAGLTGAAIVGGARIRAGSQTRLWIATIATWAALAFCVVYPKILPYSYGLYDSWYGLSGVEILMTGRCALMLMLAGGLTAVTLWRERAAAARAETLSMERVRFAAGLPTAADVAGGYALDSCAGDDANRFSTHEFLPMGIPANHESNDNTRHDSGVNTVDGVQDEGFGGPRAQGRK